MRRRNHSYGWDHCHAWTTEHHWKGSDGTNAEGTFQTHARTAKAAMIAGHVLFVALLRDSGIRPDS